LVMDKILVVGGAGYVGSHCCKLLRERGYIPVVFDNFSTGHRDFVKWGPVEQGDIRDSAALESAIERHKPVAAMHFAAKTLVGESVAKPTEYYSNNVVGTLTLLETLRTTGVNKLVFSSTCAIYADLEGKNLDEKAPKGPNSPYGFSKLVCEQMMDDFAVAHNIRSVRLRYFNAAGADVDCEIGEHHEPETHLIPLALDVALGRRHHIEIFGKNYNTPDGSAVRDYVHVADLASAHLQALEYLKADLPTVAINLGAGTGHSVLEVVRSVERVVGRSIATKNGPRRPGDVAALVADASVARKILSWRPIQSKLDQIVADAWQWHQKRFTI
jgi:UDP-glucose-4-epimerase GalE